MKEIYLTMEEAAELEGIGYSAIRMRICREEDKYKIIKEQGENGGKDKMMIALSSLSKKAQKTYSEKQKLLSLAETKTEVPIEVEAKEAPWYTQIDIDWYMKANKKAYYKAMELGNVVREWLDYTKKDKTEYADTFARERLGKDKRTLYRYTKTYLEAGAWASKLHDEDGGNYEYFKVLCLCRKPKETGTFPSFTEEVKQVIKNIWFNKDFAANQGTREMLYEKLIAIKNLNKWEKIPSYNSVVRYIAHLMNDEGMKSAWYLASRGEREYRNKMMVKSERSTKDLKVMEILMGDEHTFDCWVAYTHPNGKVSAIKPKLIAWIDIKSRKIMGDLMCKDANSEILKQSLLKLLYHDAGSVPEYLYMDNGKDYTAKEMTGVARNDRQRANFDDTTKGFYQSIGVKDYHRALPYYSWTKGNIERFFGTVCSKFSKWFTSYTGTLTGSKTFAKVKKDIKGMLERGELLTMEEFYEEWTKWLTEVYDIKEQSGLKKQGEKYITPQSCYENEERYFKPLPPKSFATLLMMKSERRLVRNTGIQFEGISYRSDDLCFLIGETVDIKYDPHDMQTIYVFKNGKQVCEAYAQELMDFASPNGVEQKALKEHLAMQKNQLKRTREMLEEANRPLEELNADFVGLNAVTGGIDLMKGKKPETKQSKIVALPEDRTFRGGFRRKEESEESDYMKKKALEALEALEALKDLREIKAM